MSDVPLDGLDTGDALDRLERARADFHDAQARIHAAVLELCPQHNVTQHRDGKPPYCTHCGRGYAGVLIKEQS